MIDDEYSATVQDFIDYLETHFKLDDKLCYMDCVEGLMNDCTYMTKEQLGKKFFYRVAALKERAIRNGSSKEVEDEMFPYVDDSDVVVS